jgi:hypothetical protein
MLKSSNVSLNSLRAHSMLLYHFVGATHGLENIRYRRLKIATLDNLNDPFELHGFVIPKAADRRAYEGWVGQLARRYGVLCFSEGWKNPVQWSHYADRHMGLCLGFEVPDDYAIKVKYVTERIKLDLKKAHGAGQVAEQFVIDALSTKYIHWVYEQERRVFHRIHNRTPVGGLYFCDFDENIKLHSVYIGCRSKVTGVQVADALGALAKTVQVHTTRLAFQTYEVCLQQSLKLQK